MLCEKFIGTRSYTHIVEPLTEVPGQRLKPLRDALDRLVQGEPIQYVTGEAFFYGSM